MQTPLRIQFKDVAPSQAIEIKVREKVQKLEQYYDRITGCRVTLGSSANRHHKGKNYWVHVAIDVPGRELVINHEHGAEETNGDIYIAMRDAFAAARKQLEHFARRERGNDKRHRHAHRHPNSDAAEEI